MSFDPTYCRYCYSAAQKAGRDVRQTSFGRICRVCESRIRNGLVHYRPSNGSEFRMFESRCNDCRHFVDDYDDPQPPKFDVPGNQCKWAILDRLIAGQWSDSDGIAFWFNPIDLRPECPAECLRFCSRDEPNGERFDPPPPDCIGQMTFSDVLVVEEVVSAASPAAGHGRAE